MLKRAKKVRGGNLCDVPKQIKGMIDFNKLIGSAVADETTVAQEPGCLGDTLEMGTGFFRQHAQKATVEVKDKGLSRIFHVDD